MAIIAVVALLSGALAPLQAVPLDISSILARAETAYYDARFNDAIALLAPIDDALATKPDRIDDRIQVNLQLALAYIGLNQIPEAKTHLGEIFDIDPQFVIDPSKFAPKVLTLFSEARAAHAADENFRKAVEEYKRGDLPQSLSKFRTILKLNPNDSLAAQYVKLIQEKLEISIGLLSLQWHSQFDAHDFSQAAATYRQLVATNLEGRADVVLEQVRSEYRKALTPMFQSWTQACKTRDRAAVSRIRTEANDLLPDVSIGEDVLSRMTDCVSGPAPLVQTVVTAVTEPAPTRECIQNSATIAMTRLKTRVEPEFPPEVQQKRVRVRAMVRIDDSGNTTVHGLTGGSPVVNRAVVKAVQNWKFYPAKVDNQARCVEAELPIELSR
jgi:Gram-negative bacterial TonB protein C-terminal